MKIYEIISSEATRHITDTGSKVVTQNTIGPYTLGLISYPPHLRRMFGCQFDIFIEKEGTDCTNKEHTHQKFMKQGEKVNFDYFSEIRKQILEWAEKYGKENRTTGTGITVSSSNPAKVNTYARLLKKLDIPYIEETLNDRKILKIKA